MNYGKPLTDGCNAEFPELPLICAVFLNRDLCKCDGGILHIDRPVIHSAAAQHDFCRVPEAVCLTVFELKHIENVFCGSL